LGRPVSPHVTIYAFPVAALASITNRVTGCALSFGCLGLGFAEIVGGSGTSLHLMQTIGGLDSMLLVAGAKISVAFPITYHYFGAMRHLVWDQTPEMLTNEGVEKSSYLLFGAAGLISTGLVFV
jgi:succinate dehydrogenase (ubiquinone) cytochrome b560 subunit